MSAPDTPSDDNAPHRPVSLDASVNGRLHDFAQVERLPASKDTRFRSSRVKALQQWWWQFAGVPPARRQFDIVEHRAIVSHLFLIEVVSPQRFQFRICGEASSAIVGRDNAHVFLDCSQVGQFGALARYYSRVVETRQPFKCYGSFHYLDQGLVDFESIDCPLCDDTGRITHLIGCIDICDKE